MASRRWLLYPLPGILVIGIVAIVGDGLSLAEIPYAIVVVIMLSALAALVTKTRTGTRPSRGISAGSEMAAVTELGVADAGSDPGWSWQAMTRRQERSATGEHVAEVVWDGREFFVDSTPAQPGQADALAYCIDVTVPEDPGTCLGRFTELAAGARSWSPARREGCAHTVEGRVVDAAGHVADVIIRIRVDELASPGSSRVRVVLTGGSEPSSVAAVLSRYVTKTDPLINLPRTARAVATALGVGDRYDAVDSATSGVVEDSLLRLVGVHASDEFSDDMLYVHRERLARASASAGSRFVSRALIALLVLCGAFVLLLVVSTRFL